MAKLPLHQGAYEARSPIANAQVAINVYPEPNPKDAPFPVTHYPSPGLSVLADFTGQITGSVRGLYMASDGQLFAVIGTTVISLSGSPGAGFAWVNLGQLTTNSGNLVSMCDNGTTLVIVDGSPQGWQLPLGAALTPGSLQLINDPAFYGSNRVDFIDTFMVFNQPGTGNFYTTTSNVVTPFDPTYFAAKEGWNDLLVCCVCLHDNIWLLGNTTAEVWFNAGGATFPFARMPNSILQQGCIAVNSPVVADNALYWLSQDRWGRNLCMRGEGYAARRVSNFAVEDEWSKYPTCADAVGMVFQLGGHETVGFYFASGNAWWAYDAATELWHKRTYSGTTTPWLPYCMAGWGHVEGLTFDDNIVVAGDRTAPRILRVDRNAYTDAGTPITRQRSWMHNQDDGQRIHHARFSCSMTGAAMTPDTINLDWSDDAGQTYGIAVPQTTDNATNGQYQWRRLGYARDRVYRLTWTGQGECALNGAYIDLVPQGT
ncbi:MAG TPA: hypothetical protein VGI28_01795 [Stellaceae bacterium]|jgi:hypothetical protein